MKKLLLTITFTILSINVSEQALNKSYIAVNAGDYDTALKEWKTLALQSDTSVHFIILQKYGES